MKERNEILQKEILRSFVYEYFTSQEEYSMLDRTPEYRRAALDTAVEIASISDRRVKEWALSFDRSSDNDWPNSLIDLAEVSKRVAIGFSGKSEEDAEILSTNLLRQAYAARKIEVKLSQLSSSPDRVDEQRGYDTAKELCIKAVVEFGCKSPSPATEKDPIAKKYFQTISK